MPQQRRHQITEAMVDAEIARYPVLLRFSPAVEAAYDDTVIGELAVWRARVYGMGAVFVILSLVSEYLLVPELLPLAATLKLGIVVPMLIASAWVSLRWPKRAVVEGCDLAITLVFSSIQYGLQLIGNSPDAVAAQSLLPILLIFPNLISKMQFAVALPMNVAIIGMVLVVGLATGNMAALNIGALLVPLTVTMSATLYANYRLEKFERRLFLQQLKTSIRHADLMRDHDELDRLSRLDPLTGLANRRELAIRLAEMWDWSVESDRDISALMLDIDHFKRFNDRYGHQAGDACLRQIANVIRAAIRRDDQIIARYGGEEFLVILPSMSRFEATQVAERIRRAVEAEAIPNDAVPLGVVTLSIGVAAARDSALDNASALLRAADVALYEAKGRGRNQVFPPLLGLASDSDNIVSWAG